MKTNEPRIPSLHAVAAAAMRENGFEPEFSPAVIAEVRALEDDEAEDARQARTQDLRALLWSSIDNPQSRDLDQVEYAERSADNSITVRLGVADVTSLVPAGSAADEHAGTNTTSVYTGVRTFPMLPERLSTDLTSLNQGVDRLAFIVQFTVSADGDLSGEAVYHALVHNHAKLSYDAVAQWLEGNEPPPAIAASASLAEQVRLQDEAAQRLRNARALAGSLNFESVEAAPVVAHGKVIDLAVVQRNRARDLIENFMVAANRCVALYLHGNGSSSIRRVVREPERWDRIVGIAAEHGVLLPAEPDSRALSDFLARRRTADPEHFADLSLSIIKLLGPGAYVVEPAGGSREDTGHFGLAVADYVHSTAPNRRYADLVTQRMLRATSSRTPVPYTDEVLAEIAQRCTERGKAARKVERTVRKVAGAVMLRDRIGDRFTAIITAASRKGSYARVLNPPVEGRVVDGAEGLDVGETVRLTLVRVDVERGHIDFAHDSAHTGRKRERRRRKMLLADQLRNRIGETFLAVVTAANERATYVRTVDGKVEGRVVRGFKSLTEGMQVPVRLIATDSVHGFIDFEYIDRDSDAKETRRSRKRAAARSLRNRIGDTFDAVVTGVSPKATWIRTADDIEGRLVRGTAGLKVGDEIRVVLLVADAQRGFIDFARDDTVVPAE